MSAVVRLDVNTIIKGKWYRAGEPIEAAILPKGMRLYIVKPKGQAAEPRHLNFETNRPYSVDAEGYLRGPPSRQAAQMEAAVEEEGAIVDAAEAEVSETVAAAIEQGREGYQTDLERQKTQARCRRQGA
jgi:hypothetical protein